jgi:hypothetical protein
VFAIAAEAMAGDLSLKIILKGQTELLDPCLNGILVLIGQGASALRGGGSTGI